MSQLLPAAIIGFGNRGQRWAKRLAGLGRPVLVFDPEHSPDWPDFRMASGITDCVQGAKLIVVCLPDRLALIRKVLQQVQSTNVPGTTILVSSALELAQIRGCATRPLEIFRIIENAADVARD